MRQQNMDLRDLSDLKQILRAAVGLLYKTAEYTRR